MMMNIKHLQVPSDTLKIIQNEAILLMNSIQSFFLVDLMWSDHLKKQVDSIQ